MTAPDATYSFELWGRTETIHDVRAILMNKSNGSPNTAAAGRKAVIEQSRLK